MFDGFYGQLALSTSKHRCAQILPLCFSTFSVIAHSLFIYIF